MKNSGIKLSLYINYFVFAILLNSVGIVIWALPGEKPVNHSYSSPFFRAYLYLP